MTLVTCAALLAMCAALTLLPGTPAPVLLLAWLGTAFDCALALVLWMRRRGS